MSWFPNIRLVLKIFCTKDYRNRGFKVTWSVGLDVGFFETIQGDCRSLQKYDCSAANCMCSC